MRFLHSLLLALFLVVAPVPTWSSPPQIGGTSTTPPPTASLCTECPPPLVWGVGFGTTPPSIPGCPELPYGPGCLPDAGSPDIGNLFGVVADGGNPPDYKVCICILMDSRTLGYERPPACGGDGVTPSDQECPEACNSQCAVAPVGDKDGDGETWPDDTDDDGDGEHWPSDRDEGPPYPPGHPFHDGDGDGMPDALDLIVTEGTGEDATKKANKSGILPSDPDERKVALQQIAKELKFTEVPDWLEPPASVDLNGDGYCTLGEALSVWRNAIVSAIGSLPAGLSIQQKFAQLSDLQAHLSVVDSMICSADAELCNSIREFGQSLKAHVDDLKAYLDNEARTEKIQIATALLGVLGGLYVDNPDGGTGVKGTFKQADGTPTSLDGEAQPKRSADKRSTTADPVSTSNGEYLYDVVDLAIPGRGLDLELRRFYASGSVHRGVVGHNWSMPLLETRAFFGRGASMAIVAWGDGTQSGYLWDPVVEHFIGEQDEFSKGRYEVLQAPECDTVASGSVGLVVRKADGSQWHFCPPSWQPGGAGGLSWLRKVVDMHGNAIVLRRNMFGQVHTIIDSLGRSIALGYNDDGLLESVSAPWLETPRAISYSYNDRDELLEVVSNQTEALDSADVVRHRAPRERYGYSEHPEGFATSPDAFQNHNLETITRNGVVRIVVSYYEATSSQFNDVDIAYSVDKVKTLDVAGQVTRFRYARIDPLVAPDPLDDPATPKITHRTDTLHADGVLERFFHGEGLLYRREIANGRFNSDWTSAGGAYAAPGEVGVVANWMDVYTYDDESRLTSVLQTNDLDFPGGRKTEYEYPVADKFRRGAATVTRRYPWPSGTPLVWTTSYDPLTGGMLTATDPLGRSVQTTYAHQELSLSAALALPEVAGFGVISASDTADAALFGKGDVNADGATGGSFRPVHVLLPPVDIAPAAGPGTATSIAPTETRVWSARGELVAHIDARGVRTDVDTTWWTDPGRSRRISAEESGGTIERARTIHVLPSGAVERIEDYDGLHRSFEYDERGLLKVIRHHAGSAPFGFLATDGSHTPPTLSGTLTANDGDDLVVNRFYDFDGRFVGSIGPRYVAPGGNIVRTVGSTPALEERSLFDAFDELVESRTFVRDSAGVLQQTGTDLRQHDGKGHTLRGTTARGASIQSQFDARGLMISRTRRDDTGTTVGVERWDYNRFGDLVRHEAPGRPAETYQSDGFGRTTGMTNSNGTTVLLDLDALGHVRSQEIKRGSTLVARTEWSRDSHDRVIQVSRSNLGLAPDGVVNALSPANLVVRFGYGPAADDLRWSAVGTGASTRLERTVRDGLGRVRGTIVGAGASPLQTTYDLSEGDRLLRKLEQLDDRGATGAVSPSAREWRFGYDSRGAPRVVIDPLGHVTQTVHDAAGNLVAFVRPDGFTARSRYDSHDRRRRTDEFGTDGLTRTTRYEYDIDGHLTAIVDPLSRRTEYDYDSLGRRSVRRFADGTSIVTVHDDADRPLTTSLPGGVVWTYGYDSVGRLSTWTATGADAGGVRTFGYDELDRRCRWIEQIAGRPSVRVERTHGPDGEILRESQRFGSDPATTVQRTFDDSGLVSSITMPSGAVASIFRDALGRVERIDASSFGTVATYTEGYGTTGHRRLQIGGGASRWFEYDAAGRSLESSVRTAGGTPIAGAALQWDLAGNVESRLSLDSGRIEEFGYDGLDRLKLWNFGVVGGTIARSATWNFDLSDNITAATDTALSGSATGVPNSLNQMLSLAPWIDSCSWSARGELDASTAGGASVTWEWDAFGRPYATERVVGATTAQVEWGYDSLDRMVMRTTNGGSPDRWTFLGGSLAKTLSNGASTEHVDGADGGPLWEQRGSSGVDVCADAFGNATTVLQAGTILRRTTFEPYGAPLDSITGVPQTFPGTERGFAGGRFDAVSGTWTLGARMHSPDMGAFVSRDPLEEAAGSNLYAYARRNPLRWSDPTGLAATGTVGPDCPGASTSGDQGDSGYTAPTTFDGRYQGAGYDTWPDAVDGFLSYDGAAEHVAEMTGVEIGNDTTYGSLGHAERGLVGMAVLEGSGHYMDADQVRGAIAAIEQDFGKADYEQRQQSALKHAVFAVIDPVGGLTESSLTSAGASPGVQKAGSFIGSFVFGGSLGTVVNKALKSHLHHVLPKFLGGAKDGITRRLREDIHREFHKELNKQLKAHGIPFPVGGRTGSATRWLIEFKGHSGMQAKAFDAVLDASRAIDVKYAAELGIKPNGAGSLTSSVWEALTTGEKGQYFSWAK